MLQCFVLRLQLRPCFAQPDSATKWGSWTIQYTTRGQKVAEILQYTLCTVYSPMSIKTQGQKENERWSVLFCYCTTWKMLKITRQEKLLWKITFIVWLLQGNRIGTFYIQFISFNKNAYFLNGLFRDFSHCLFINLLQLDSWFKFAEELQL